MYYIVGVDAAPADACPTEDVLSTVPCPVSAAPEIPDELLAAEPATTSPSSESEASSNPWRSIIAESTDEMSVKNASIANDLIMLACLCIVES